MSAILFRFPQEVGAAPALEAVQEHPVEGAPVGETAHPTPPTPSLLQPGLGLPVFTLLVFALVFALLAKFAWKPITQAMEAREHNISDSLKRAEVALAEAARIQADNDRARRESEQEAQRILREARETADKLRAEDIEKTKAQIAQLQQQATAEIERQKQGALEALRSEVADLAVAAAEKIIRHNLDASAQRKLVDEFIQTLPSKN